MVLKMKLLYTNTSLPVMSTVGNSAFLSSAFPVHSTPLSRNPLSTVIEWRAYQEHSARLLLVFNDFILPWCYCCNWLGVRYQQTINKTCVTKHGSWGLILLIAELLASCVTLKPDSLAICSNEDEKYIGPLCPREWEEGYQKKKKNSWLARQTRLFKSHKR